MVAKRVKRVVRRWWWLLIARWWWKRRRERVRSQSAGLPTTNRRETGFQFFPHFLFYLFQPPLRLPSLFLLFSSTPSASPPAPTGSSSTPYISPCSSFIFFHPCSSLTARMKTTREAKFRKGARADSIADPGTKIRLRVEKPAGNPLELPLGIPWKRHFAGNGSSIARPPSKILRRYTKRSFAARFTTVISRVFANGNQRGHLWCLFALLLQRSLLSIALAALPRSLHPCSSSFLELSGNGTRGRFPGGNNAGEISVRASEPRRCFRIEKSIGPIRGRTRTGTRVRLLTTLAAARRDRARRATSHFPPTAINGI